MTAWLGHGPLGSPGGGYGYGGLVLGPFNVHGPSIRARAPYGFTVRAIHQKRRTENNDESSQICPPCDIMDFEHDVMKL